VFNAFSDTVLASLQETQVIVLLVVLFLLILWESFHPFYDFFKKSKKERAFHGLKNVVIGLTNGLMISLMFVGLWFAASVWAAEQRFGVLHWMQDLVVIPDVARALIAILILDAWMYAWHRMNHEIPFFWRFHRVHHSDNKMDVTTASRFHIGEIFFSSVLRIPIILFFGIYLWELVLYEIIMFAVVQFHHANIKLPGKIDPLLRLIIVTPNMHRVHHSRWQPETDSNYSSLFSFWDRIARTFRINHTPEHIKLGLDEFDSEEHQSFKGILKTPLITPENSVNTPDIVKNSSHKNE